MELHGLESHDGALRPLHPAHKLQQPARKPVITQQTLPRTTILYLFQLLNTSVGMVWLISQKNAKFFPDVHHLLS